MPLALVVGIQPGSMTCGGFAGWPCMTGPLLLGTSSTPWGLHHLGNNPIFILDGIFGTAPPAGTGPGGVLPVAGTGIIDTITNGGVEMSFAIQALVADPLSPSGASLSACLTVSQWVFWL
jgi:hypothetical protein